ncbi:hypothetical protein SUGI_0677630 [Cryptomeria japonica]|nr:hypothetical protein SUGI_0677630 [Cryptomeria japonica]
MSRDRQDKEVSKEGSSYWKDDRNFYRRREPDGYRNENFGRQDKRTFRGTYFKCGGEGHRAFECKKSETTRRAVVVEENPTGSKNKSEDGELLMMRIALCHTREDKEPLQRKNPFKTRCKVFGKCCKVVIDSGSLDNLVSKEMVNKLKLERLKHPKPYQIAWIQDEHKLLVSEQCLVKLKIGNYHDEVLCDIMPMDIYHFFLGRPWQFDRQTIHDGRKNTYTIVANGMKKTFLPLEEPLKNEVCKNTRIYLVDGRKFIDGLRHENVCFALIPKRTKRPEPKGEHPIEIRDLQIEYEDIISDNLPDGLLPIRSISHCMDLVPRASLPKKAIHQ